MNDEDLLQALGEVARDEAGEPFDARWDAMAADELSDEDRAALEALAAGDPELADAPEAFAPLDDAAKERITDSILLVLEQEKAPAPVLKFPTRRVLLVAAPLAAAAALLFMLLPRGADLPAYGLDASKGEMSVRGSGPAAEVPIYKQGTRLDLILRPATKVQGGAQLRTFVKQAGAVRDWNIPHEVAPGGAFRIAGAAETLLPQPGDYELIFAIGPPKGTPTAQEVSGEGPWQTLRYRLKRE